MRLKIASGNWKMNLSLEEGKNLIADIMQAAPSIQAGKAVIFCVPFPYLIPAKELTDTKAGFFVAAQNIAAETEGAYTGEVSGKILQSIGIQYVVIGHSERRDYYGETNDIIAKKIAQALANNITPIYCFGESLEKRENGSFKDFIKAQILASFKDITAEDAAKIIFAYEPIWAIGTGLTASPEQAEEVHAFVRSVLTERYDAELAEKVSILYGGSVKASNATSIFSQADVDGGLVGGASLQAAEFVNIIKAL